MPQDSCFYPFTLSAFCLSLLSNITLSQGFEANENSSWINLPVKQKYFSVIVDNIRLNDFKITSLLLLLGYSTLFQIQHAISRNLQNLTCLYHKVQWFLLDLILELLVPEVHR